MVRAPAAARVHSFASPFVRSFVVIVGRTFLWFSRSPTPSLSTPLGINNRFTPPLPLLLLLNPIRLLFVVLLLRSVPSDGSNSFSPHFTLPSRVEGIFPLFLFPWISIELCLVACLPSSSASASLV